MSTDAIRVTCRIETSGNVAAVAHKIAADQSAGTFTELPREAEAVRKRCAARAQSVASLEADEIIDVQHPSRLPGFQGPST